MKKIQTILLFITFFLLYTLPSAGADATCATKQTATTESTKNSNIHSIEIPALCEGYITSGISVPTQPLVRNNNHNNPLRPTMATRLPQSRVQNTSVHPSNRLYDLSAPFYCTPPCKYYIYALRKLII